VDAPWIRRARVIGLEPQLSSPGQGIAEIARRTGSQFRLTPGEQGETTLSLHVLSGLSDVTGVIDGRVTNGGQGTGRAGRTGSAIKETS
jgi:hypothetical protein